MSKSPPCDPCSSKPGNRGLPSHTPPRHSWGSPHQLPPPPIGGLYPYHGAQEQYGGYPPPPTNNHYYNKTTTTYHKDEQKQDRLLHPSHYKYPEHSNPSTQQQISHEVMHGGNHHNVPVTGGRSTSYWNQPVPQSSLGPRYFGHGSNSSGGSNGLISASPTSSTSANGGGMKHSYYHPPPHHAPPHHPSAHGSYYGHAGFHSGPPSGTVASGEQSKMVARHGAGDQVGPLKEDFAPPRHPFSPPRYSSQQQQSTNYAGAVATTTTNVASHHDCHPPPPSIVVTPTRTPLMLKQRTTSENIVLSPSDYHNADDDHHHHHHHPYNNKTSGIGGKLNKDCDEDGNSRYIWDLRDTDIVCGRGAPTSFHQGNQLFRDLVTEYQTVYLCSKRSDKPRIAMELLDMISHRGGRFVRRVKVPHRGRFGWEEIDEKRAYEKVCQALREGAPELRRKMLASTHAIRGEQQQQQQEQESQDSAAV